jgi:hypothetical protein
MESSARRVESWPGTASKVGWHMPSLADQSGVRRDTMESRQW